MESTIQMPQEAAQWPQCDTFKRDGTIGGYEDVSSTLDIEMRDERSQVQKTKLGPCKYEINDDDDGNYLSLSPKRFGEDDKSSVELDKIVDTAEKKYEEGHPTEAVRSYRAGIESVRKKYGPFNVVVASLMMSLSSMLRRLGNVTEALEWIDRAIEINKHFYGAQSTEIAEYSCHRADALKERAKNDLLEAAKGFKGAIDIYESKPGPKHPSLAKLYKELGSIHKQGCIKQTQGKYHKAEMKIQRAVLISEEDSTDDGSNDASNTGLSVNNVNESLSAQRCQSLRPQVPKAASPSSCTESNQDTDYDLDQNLHQHGLRLHSVKRDGDCQFRALAYMLNLGEQQHSFLRHIVISYMRHQSERFKDFVEAVKYEEYCSQMERPQMWGDLVTLHAAADLFSVNIVLVRPTDTKRIVCTSTNSPRDTINLANQDRHYDATDPIEEHKFQLFYRWSGGRMLNELPRGCTCTGQWHLLVYRNEAGYGDEIITRRILRSLKQNIPAQLNHQLSRFFAFEPADRYDHICIVIVIDFSRNGSGDPIETKRNARFKFHDQFDFNHFRAQMFRFEGYPDPRSIEWNVKKEVPMERWALVDGRSRKRLRDHTDDVVVRDEDKRTTRSPVKSSNSNGSLSLLSLAEFLTRNPQNEFSAGPEY